MAKVLVVDDAAVMRQMLKQVLIQHGIDVVTAENGEEALSILQAERDIRVLLCDLHMPAMDGEALVTAINEHQMASQLSIFMLTTETNTELKEKFKNLGVSGWISKPVLPTTVVEVVKNIIA